MQTFKNLKLISYNLKFGIASKKNSGSFNGTSAGCGIIKASLGKDLDDASRMLVKDTLELPALTEKKNFRGLKI